MLHFFKKLLGNPEKKNNITPASLDPANAATYSQDDVERLLTPLVRPATKLQLQALTAPPSTEHTNSHFGGRPYFEKGEVWPQSKKGRNLQFIFQVFNTPGLELPGQIKLLQFYYDFEEEPWQTESDGWLVKIYEKLDSENQVVLETPEELMELPYCEIDFESVQSLPSWEGIDGYSKETSDLCCALNTNAPWETYDSVVKQLTGKTDYQSQLGGYPDWLQGDETPMDSKGRPMPLLFQIDSEDNADLVWGDLGLVYAFYDAETKQVAFVMQCH